jgi:hypothetical protein
MRGMSVSGCTADASKQSEPFAKSARKQPGVSDLNIERYGRLNGSLVGMVAHSCQLAAIPLVSRSEERGRYLRTYPSPWPCSSYPSVRVKEAAPAARYSAMAAPPASTGAATTVLVFVRITAALRQSR